MKGFLNIHMAYKVFQEYIKLVSLSIWPFVNLFVRPSVRPFVNLDQSFALNYLLPLFPKPHNRSSFIFGP